MLCCWRYLPTRVLAQLSVVSIRDKELTIKHLVSTVVGGNEMIGIIWECAAAQA